MVFKISKFSSLSFLIILVVLVLFGSVFYQLQKSEAQVANYDLMGWVWSDNYGWVSLNFLNTKGPVPYGVKIDAANNLTGWGWSEHVGWVCFGSTCGQYTKDNECGSAITPDNSALIVNLDPDSNRINGWAKVCSLKSDGWIHLSRAMNNGGNKKGEACYNCEPKCNKWKQSCKEGECFDVEPCLESSDTDYYSCKTCFSDTRFDSENIPDKLADSVPGGSGYGLSNCKGNEIPNDSDEYCHKVDSDIGSNYRVICAICSTNQIYSSSFSDNGSLLGWAWNGDGSDGKVGAGWIHMGSSGFIVYPWLETKYGSIFGRNDVRQKTGSGGNNATYCIFAKDIQHISSESCDQNLVTGVEIQFPTSEDANQVYRNALGKIDVKGLTEIVFNSKFNKYGQEVKNINSLNNIADGILNNKVYIANIVNGKFTVDSGFTFQNGAVGTSQKGNGTIVVNGDLVINKNLNYNLNLPTNLKQLASVAWIVKGDVVIKETVDKVVGAFMVLGNGSTCGVEAGSDSDYPKYVKNGCGVVFSGDSNVALTVNGLMVAKAFDFRRTYTSPTQGSERIIYDGRLSVNPPPGFSGFVEGLPIIRDFSY